MPTLTELQDARALQLNIIDDLLRTAAADGGRALTADELVRHDAAVLAIEGDDTHEGLDAQIVRAQASDRTAEITRAADIRRARYDVPNINVRGHASIKADRNLDQILWATDEVVRGSDGRSFNPVEQIVVRADGGVAVPAPRITAWRPDDREVVRAFQNQVADMCIAGFMLDRSAKTSKEAFQVARATKHFGDQYTHILRAMDVDTATEGTEWVPTGIGASLHEKVRSSGKVAPLFGRVDIPTPTWKWPIEGADVTAYRVGEPTADNESKMTASTPGTTAATFDAEIIGARALFSRTIDMASAIAILPHARQKIVQAFVDAEEKAILDGDSDGTHQDGVAGSTDARTLWDGLRKKGLAQTLVTNTTCTAAKLLILRGGMGKWGVNPADLAYIIGVSNYLTLIQDTNLITVDKLGPQATLLNGQVGSIGGVPVIVSEHVREDLNATGVYDGITTTKTVMLCVNRNEWAMGQYMPLDIRVDDVLYSETFQRVMIGFMLEDFQHIGSAATNDDTALSYNVTP